MRLLPEMAVSQLFGILKLKVRKNISSIAYHDKMYCKDMSKDAEKEYYVKEKQSDW